MPILTTEVCVYPSDLLNDVAGDQNRFDDENVLDDPCWWVFYTRARQEKSLARDLLQREIGFYLPVVARRLLIRGRAVHSYVPLLTGYVFGYCSNADRVRALMTNRVAQVLAVADPVQLRRDLQNIQVLIDSGAPLTVEARLEAMQPVRVRAGALAGLEGTVVRRKKQTRLVIGITMLQQGVSLEIDDFLLEPIS